DRHAWEVFGRPELAEFPLGRDGRGECARHVREGRLCRFADDLEDGAVLWECRLLQRLDHALDARGSLSIVGVPAAGSALEFREEERNDSRWEFGHDVSSRRRFHMRRIMPVASTRVSIRGYECPPTTRRIPQAAGRV